MCVVKTPGQCQACLFLIWPCTISKFKSYSNVEETNPVYENFARGNNRANLLM